MKQLDPFALRHLPTPARLLLSTFVCLIGLGYLSAVGNLYQRHELSDEREGLTLDDLRANFHGIDAPHREQDDRSSTPSAPKSRMLEQIQPGGEMRKELIKGKQESVRALTTWLARGALEKEFNQKSLVETGDPSASRVIQLRCLSCHNIENGEKPDTPYGPDMFDIDYQMVWKYAAPGSAQEGASQAAGSAASQTPSPRKLGPQSLGHLLLVSHIHMLAIPVYTLILGLLFLLTRLPETARNWVAVAPMFALVADFGAWWLARFVEGFVLIIPAAGAIYGLGIGVQILIILASMWLGKASK